ncbi:hypothetical protein KIW84_032953 [Lathyrus oleraceus]|uniref:Uncharacterized protein n=1 Tax=Pisum sativum TaxID=3888 RepID=A0A9D4XWA3_PEA|nr:hypothetical protein KIW84_032953 [Pisum sativum]
MNSEAHKEALQRVLEQDFAEHDVIVDQFDHIVANITSCNNLSFCDEELLEEGKNHNLALHISMNCKEYALSNVLVDTGSSLNMLPKSTLSKLSYQGAPIRYSGVIVKDFDGSRKIVIGEVDLLVKIGLSDFQITFQASKSPKVEHPVDCVVTSFTPKHNPYPIGGRTTFCSDFHPRKAMDSYGRSCYLHITLEAQICEEWKACDCWRGKALLVSHLSSFYYVEAEDEVGTPFQALYNVVEKRVGEPMSSLKDAKKIVEEGDVD